jgi:hypothetical protein
MRRYILYFGALFNDIYINRYDSSNNVIQSTKVPITYASKEKFLERVLGDPNLTKPVAIDLPRMYFLLTSLAYDGQRKLNPSRQIFYKANTATIDSIYNPVAYNFFFSLGILVKNAQDGTKIMEEIVPYFTPSFTSTLNVLPEMEIQHDIPLSIQSITYEDLFEGAWTQRKSMMWTINFIMKGYLYGPITESGLIKQMHVNFRIPTTNTASEGIGNTAISEHLYAQVGLTANGTPANTVATSIPIADITITEDWGKIIGFDNDAEGVESSNIRTE